MNQTHLRTVDVTAGYGQHVVLEDLDFEVPDGSFTIIIGPNACGKSTLLRVLARLLSPQSGQVLLNGVNISRLNSRALARKIGFLPQSPSAPEGITVSDLVSFGRHPYRQFFQGWTREDDEAVRSALERTQLTGFRNRLVGQLSGGQRQRVWIAMALAQETQILLLDEPTTFLDVAHQLDVLNLCAELNRGGRTLMAVLHDINQAARYATHLVAMKDGQIVAAGNPTQVITEGLIEFVFGVSCRIFEDPETGRPLVIPRAPSLDPTIGNNKNGGVDVD